MEASSIKQGDLTVTDYFTKLRIIWDEMENFQPDPTCSCKCSCGVTTLQSEVSCAFDGSHAFDE